MEYPNETLKEFNLNFSYITVNIRKQSSLYLLTYKEFFILNLLQLYHVARSNIAKSGEIRTEGILRK